MDKASPQTPVQRYSATLHIGRKDNPEALLRDPNGEYVKFDDYERLLETVKELRFELQNWLFAWGTTGPLSARTQALLDRIPAKEGETASASRTIATLERDLASTRERAAVLERELTRTVEALERANSACEQAGRTIEEYRGKYGSLPPTPACKAGADRRTRTACAQELFARFDFGLELEGFDGFEDSGANEVRRTIYLSSGDEIEGSQKAWFIVRFKHDSADVAEAYAITRSGNLFGQLPV